MAAPNPSVSVIIPVYNGERYLAEAIDSVLAQTCRPVEVIVVDDGSEDSSAAVAQHFSDPVRYCFQTHAGAAAARNRGVELAGGGFLAFLDADDVWVAEKLALQMAAFDRDPGLDLVFGHAEQFYSPDLDERVRATIQCPDEPMPGYHPGAMLIRRDAFCRVGRFDTTWQIGEFIDWYLKAKDIGLRDMMLPDVVLRRRLHATNQGVLKRHHHADYVRILKTALDRRRAQHRHE